MSTENSVKMCDAAYDVFELPVQCRDEAERYYTSYHDDAAETFSTQRPSFRITTKDLDEFLDMSNSFLQSDLTLMVKKPTYAFGVVGAAPTIAAGGAMTLTQATTLAVGATPGVCTVDGGGNGVAVAEEDLLNGENGGLRILPLNVFNQMRYLINDQEVERVENPGDVVDVKRMLDHSAVGAKSLQSITGRKYDADEADYAYDLTDSEIRTPNDNIRFSIPLAHVLACIDQSKIAKGLRHTIQMVADWTADNMFPYLPAGNNDWEVSSHYISKMRLFVPICKPSLEAIAMYEQSLKAGEEAIRVFETANHYKSNDFTAASSYSWNIVSLANKPTRVAIFMKNNNDANLPHLRRAVPNYTKVELRVNSRVLPVQPYEFDDADYVRAYMEYLNCANRALNDEDSEPPLTYKAWKAGQQIFTFKMPDDQSIFEGVKTNDLNVKVSFDASVGTVSHAIHAVVFSETKLEFKGMNDRLTVTQSSEPLN